MVARPGNKTPRWCLDTTHNLSLGYGRKSGHDRILCRQQAVDAELPYANIFGIEDGHVDSTISDRRETILEYCPQSSSGEYPKGSKAHVVCHPQRTHAGFRASIRAASLPSHE